jgi:RNA polymerase sigma-70 factor, ECF subfamily
LQFQPFDEPYVERLRAGDPRTQEHFVAYFSELIQLKVRARLRTVQAMEDVKQETFARVLTKLRTPNGIRSPERLGAFVNSICNNVLLEQYRENHRTISIENESDQDFPDHDTDVEREVADREMEQKVREILDEMPERDRRILRAIFLEERDKDEVCREFGVARDYLRVLLHRAKKVFKEEYRKIIDRGIDKRP